MYISGRCVYVRQWQAQLESYCWFVQTAARLTGRMSPGFFTQLFHSLVCFFTR